MKKLPVPKTKFIVFDGPDNSGKSTLIQEIASTYQDRVVEVKFNKTTPSGALLRINTEKDFEILFSAFDLFEKSRTYLLDRFIVSNLVYDKVFRNEDTSISEYYYKEFKERFDVLEVFVSRPPAQADFIDDRIKMSKDQFNKIIDEYKKYGTNYQILNRDLNDKPSTPTDDRDYVLRTCAGFI